MKGSVPTVQQAAGESLAEEGHGQLDRKLPGQSDMKIKGHEEAKCKDKYLPKRKEQDGQDLQVKECILRRRSEGGNITPETATAIAFKMKIAAATITAETAAVNAAEITPVIITQVEMW
ncbi:hypothetical protein [Parablautia muri]|uniref:Uncharacterized protein n=1 Tax=Parablautia muri TaxID=2320879 RepID=A0A9X5GRE5_9FIRM|nr:hypothetical protein [Parablautia muri]NBJ91975.1 hypothetical protein [Parablautia muri]